MKKYMNALRKQPFFLTMFKQIFPIEGRVLDVRVTQLGKTPTSQQMGVNALWQPHMAMEHVIFRQNKNWMFRQTLEMVYLLHFYACRTNKVVITSISTNTARFASHQQTVSNVQFIQWINAFGGYHLPIITHTYIYIYICRCTHTMYTIYYIHLNKHTNM